MITLRWLRCAHPYSPPRRPSLCPHWTVQPDLHNCHEEEEGEEEDARLHLDESGNMLSFASTVTEADDLWDISPFST